MFSKIPAFGRYEHSDHADYAHDTVSSADRLRHVERIARLMDSEFKIPGTTFKFGLDPVIGLIPGIGNLATSAVSGMLIWTMMKHGASNNVVIRMALNLVIDAVVGAIPIIGNLFDFAFRANDRNVELLRRHYEEGKYQGSGRGLIAAVLVGLAVFLVGAVWLTWQFVSWFFNVLFD
jgi:hypothetical protein